VVPQQRGGSEPVRITAHSVHLPHLSVTQDRTSARRGDAMDKLTFYRGVLCALATKRDEFIAQGEDFHKAFASTVDYARTLTTGEPLSLTLHLDPVFGIYHEATEMLLEGEQDLLLSLMNPRLQRARFKIDHADAEQELREMPDAQFFRKLGEHLDSCLAQ
jgi:hypothetical protein